MIALQRSSLATRVVLYSVATEWPKLLVRSVVSSVSLSTPLPAPALPRHTLYRSLLSVSTVEIEM